MNEIPNNSEIPCEEVLLRVILKPKHVDNDGRARAEAFLLRPQDEGKLSTFRAIFTSTKMCRDAFKKCFGVVTLHCGHIRATEINGGVPLDVIGDALADDVLPGHASILNLPDKENDPFLAERIASLLRDQSRSAG